MKFVPIKYVPLLIAGQVFIHLLIPHRLLLNAPAIILLLLILKTVSSRRINRTLRIIKKVAVPAFAFWTISMISILNTSTIDNTIIYRITTLYMSIVYLFLSCLYCSSISAVKRLTKYLIAAGLLQLPIMVAQGLGITNLLPGRLSESLSPEAWGGALGRGTMIRYPGTLGSFDISSEYLGIAFLLAMGVVIFSVRNCIPIWKALLSSAGIAVAGLFTATRGFLLGVLGGLLLYLILAIKSKKVRKKNLYYLPFLFAALFFAIRFSAPEQIVSDSMTRIRMSKITGENAFNRTQFFREWNTLIPTVPVFGYGMNLSNILNSTGGIPDAHNVFYSILLGSGWYALAAFLILLYGLISSCRKSIKHSSINVSSLGYIYLIILLYWIISEMRMEFIKQYYYINIIFGIFGIITALPYLKDTACSDLRVGCQVTGSPPHI